MSRQAEVAWGTSQEKRVAARWRDVSPSAADAAGIVKMGSHDDFDFVVFSKSGLVLCYLEVKVRRTRFGLYGDAIFPLRKHVLGERSKRLQGIRALAVTEYGCGTLVEVDLSSEPARRCDITRRDRPGQSVPHVFYTDSQLVVLEKGEPS